MKKWDVYEYAEYISLDLLNKDKKLFYGIDGIIRRLKLLKRMDLVDKKLYKKHKSREFFSYFVKKENIDELIKIVNNKKKIIGIKICEICKKEYIYSDPKNYICEECRKPKEVYCKCGCGEKVLIVNRNYKGYIKGHKNKGKTYFEIYGTNRPKCGFQLGENNVAKRADIRIKISEGVKKSYENNPNLLNDRRDHFHNVAPIAYSKISQKLFWEIYNRLERKEHIYFAELNKEFQKTDNIKHIGYYFDFTDTITKKIIEFNGNLFHANPKIFNETDINISPYSPKLTAKEIWENDKIKMNFIKSLGFDMLVVWENEYINEKEETIKRCLDFFRS